MNKVCPIMSGPKDKTDCLRDKCALFVTTYTTELIRVDMCAFESISLKNSEGKISV